MTRAVVVGATKNFFKVGHTTFRTLARTRPDIRLRLGILDTIDAAKSVEGIDVELHSWDPYDERTLENVLQGCDVMLMVPPIDGRVARARTYLESAKKSGISYILCLGIQFPGSRTAMGVEVEKVNELLLESGIAHDVVKLPVFLENLLYQSKSIREDDTFRYPIHADQPFSYVTCADLGEVFARCLTDPAARGVSELLTASKQTTCRDWALHLSEVTGRTIEFIKEPDDLFVNRLTQNGMSSTAAESVLDLWKQIEAAGDEPPSSVLSNLLGRGAQSEYEWTDEHACCFKREQTGSCPHPHPPSTHVY